MEASSIPQVKISKSGNEFKILNVTGTKGSAMDTHFSTGEAILSVFRGEAVLKLGEKEMHLLRVSWSSYPRKNRIHCLYLMILKQM